MNFRFIVTAAVILAGFACLTACAVYNTNTVSTSTGGATAVSNEVTKSSSNKATFKNGDSLAPFEREQLSYATVYISDCEAGMPTQKIFNKEILDDLYDAAKNTVVGDVVDDLMGSDGGDIYTFYDADDAILSTFAYAGSGMIYQDDHRYDVENINEIRKVAGILDYNELLEFDFDSANYKDGIITIE